MMDQSGTSLQIKGVRDGLMVTIGEGAWSEILESLISQIDDRIQFFKGARLTLDVGNRIVYAADLGLMRDKLADRQVVLWAVLSTSPVTEQTAQVLGLATRAHSAPRREQVMKPVESSLPGENAIFVQRTLRSGFQVISKAHVIVVGDINPGAEIRAGGSVVVWGRLRGAVEAGTEIGDAATICALEMAPMQIRIAEREIMLPFRRGKPQPEMVGIRNGQIFIEPWKAKEK
ncbi:MAG TPA: septum site-determining protein MinC [Anaerolineaceae bacterium]|jgi:septum site-determining protein MinC|nr:septum site-determining protein MinC [Anaerolineaceae bacterium]HQO96619.1 septum site-determining protein MinC [Anaerolineaceae bacterium]HQP59749.1 septum site-determining protein MinC [Anaerolineaceae bacterium]